MGFKIQKPLVKEQYSKKLISHDEEGWWSYSDHTAIVFLILSHKCVSISFVFLYVSLLFAYKKLLLEDIQTRPILPLSRLVLVLYNHYYVLIDLLYFDQYIHTCFKGYFSSEIYWYMQRWREKVKVDRGTAALKRKSKSGKQRDGSVYNWRSLRHSKLFSGVGCGVWSYTI